MENAIEAVEMQVHRLGIITISDMHISKMYKIHWETQRIPTYIINLFLLSFFCICSIIYIEY